MIIVRNTYWYDSGNHMSEEVVLGVTEHCAVIPCPFGKTQIVHRNKLFETPEEALKHVNQKLGKYEEFAEMLKDQIIERAKIEERAKEESHFDDIVNEGRGHE